MWFMVRGTRSTSSRTRAEQPSTVADLRREHERLGAQIENLDGEHAEASHAAAESAPLTASPAGVTMAGARDTLVP